MNENPNFPALDRAIISSELEVDRILEDARRQTLAVAEELDVIDTISDEYRHSTQTPDLARTIRLAKSLGATVRVVVSTESV